MTILNSSQIGVKTVCPERLQAPRLRHSRRQECLFGRPKPPPVDASSQGVRISGPFEDLLAMRQEFWRNHILGVRSARENDVAGRE